MPTYAYRCQDCGHQFDIFQKFSDSALTICPNCAGHIRRVIQPTGVVFKGSGFYINDSRAKPSAAKSTSDTAPGDNNTDKPAANTDGKPDKVTTSPDSGSSGKGATDPAPASKTKTPASAAARD